MSDKTVARVREELTAEIRSEPRTYRDRHGETWTRAGSVSDRREPLMQRDLFWRTIE